MQPTAQDIPTVAAIPNPPNIPAKKSNGGHYGRISGGHDVSKHRSEQSAAPDSAFYGGYNGEKYSGNGGKGVPHKSVTLKGIYRQYQKRIYGYFAVDRGQNAEIYRVAHRSYLESAAQ